MSQIQQKSNDYLEFCAKFDTKPTTDECYTPKDTKEAIERFFIEEFHIVAPTIDPFWPGRNYQDEDYTGKVVIANPPFSMTAKICDWFHSHGVLFVLYCNGLTAVNMLRHEREKWLGVYFCKECIEYETGMGPRAKVRTAFVTNMATGVHYRPGIVPLQHHKKWQKRTRPEGVMTSSDFMTAGNRYGGDIDWAVEYIRTKPVLYGGAVKILKEEKR